jgi:hypothetical protein
VNRGKKKGQGDTTRPNVKATRRLLWDGVRR